jgi:hypothetical protein
MSTQPPDQSAPSGTLLLLGTIWLVPLPIVAIDVFDSFPHRPRVTADIIALQITLTAWVLMARTAIWLTDKPAH